MPTIRPYQKLSILEAQKLFDSNIKGPSILDMINDLYEQQEEVLLAVMAAGIPANCIALIKPEHNNVFDFNSNTISIGFRFIRGI